MRNHPLLPEERGREKETTMAGRWRGWRRMVVYRHWKYFSIRLAVTGRDSTDPFLSICTTGFPMRQGRSLMRDASSSGHGNNSTEIVTDVRICHPIFKSRSFQRFFFFRISLSLDEIRYYRVFFFFTWWKRESCNWTYCQFGLSMNWQFVSRSFYLSIYSLFFADNRDFGGKWQFIGSEKIGVG